MKRVLVVVLSVCTLMLSQTLTGQDAKTVVATASKTMGVDGLNSIHFYGVAQNGNLGQNNNANQPWPMANASDYVRAIDFTQRRFFLTQRVGCSQQNNKVQCECDSDHVLIHRLHRFLYNNLSRLWYLLEVFALI